MDKQSTERTFEFLLHSNTVALITFHSKENGGFFGKGNVVPSFVNIDSTSDMVDRSLVLFCIHRRPIWIHLNSLYLTHGLLIVGSISCSP